MELADGWCIGLQSWLRGFDAQLGHLHDACTSLPQKFQAAIKWLAIKKKRSTEKQNLQQKIQHIDSWVEGKKWYCVGNQRNNRKNCV